MHADVWTPDKEDLKLGFKSQEVIEMERKYPLHTVFIHNVPYECTSEDIKKRAEKYGEISLYYPLINKKGICFVSYFDIRCAEKAKDEFNSMVIDCRHLEATYAYKPEFDTKRDLCKMCSTVTVKAASEVDPEAVKSVLSTYGELRDFEVLGLSSFVVKYFDSRIADKVVSDQPTVGGVKLEVEFQPDKDMTSLLPARARPRSINKVVKKEAKKESKTKNEKTNREKSSEKDAKKADYYPAAPPPFPYTFIPPAYGQFPPYLYPPFYPPIPMPYPGPYTYPQPFYRDDRSRQRSSPSPPPKVEKKQKINNGDVSNEINECVALVR